MTTALAVMLFSVATGLMAWHHRAWGRACKRLSDPDELDYSRSQYRRRMQTSALIALVGVALLAGDWLTQPTARVISWSSAVLLLLWIVSLAFADAVATRMHFARVARRDLSQHLDDLTKIAHHAGSSAAAASRRRSDGAN